jgi:AAA+ ATPase superfamily predicted ATPase
MIGERMLERFYPRDQRDIFTNRQRELTLLDFLKQEISQGRPQRLAVWGLRRIGKTLLIKEFFTRLLSEGWSGVPVYINLERVVSSPENFGMGYIGWTLHWCRISLGHDEAALPGRYFDIQTLLTQGFAFSQRSVEKALTTLANELAKEKPNRHLLLELALSFPQDLGQELGRPILLCLDEFQEMLALERYGLKDILALFRAILQESPDVSYILAGSAITVFQRMVGDHQSPLFAQLERLPLSPFTPEDTKALIAKVAPEITDAEARQEIARLTGGHPSYVVSLARRTRYLVHLNDLAPSAETVRYAFLVDTLSPDGDIYNFCKYIYDVSLQRASGYGPLKAILQLLAERDEKPSTLARRLKVSRPTVMGYLRNLEEVDLICKEGDLYRYHDPVLRFWVAMATVGIEVGPFPRREELAGLVAQLDERFQRASSELGLAKEFEVREILRKFQGQEVPGELLGSPGTVRLPLFRSVEPYRSPDGQIEIDALAKGDEVWAVEVKWRNKEASVTELRRFVAKTREHSPHRLWFISKMGFSPAARTFAQERGILISDQVSLSQLARLVGVGFGP